MLVVYQGVIGDWEPHFAAGPKEKGEKQRKKREQS